MSSDFRMSPMFICPCCGGSKRMGNGQISLPYCNVCGTKFVDTHIAIKDFMSTSGAARDKLTLQLQKQYVYSNPSYDPKMEKVRIALKQKQKVQPRLMSCPVCNNQTSSSAPNCIHCGQPIAEMMEDAWIEREASAILKEKLSRPTGPHCPHCNSEHIEKIGSFDRVTSIMFWGLASSKIGKQYKCKSCGHKW